jgi:periplasmic protein CpxP/Spy
MKSIRTVVCCLTLLLALGAVAAQNPTSPPAPSGQPQAAPPQGQPQTAPPASPQGQPPQGTVHSMQPPTIDDQVKALSQELNLTTDQQAKTKTILEDQRSQAMTIVNDSSLQREAKIEKLQTLREGTIAKVRTLLDDGQKKKLDQMLQGDDEQAPKKDQPANPPPK